MFKSEFKYYKSKHPTPDFSAVSNIKDSFSEHKCITPTADFNASLAALASILGLKPVVEWKICELYTNPGLIFIVNPFTSVGQRYWISRCLRDYTCKPNRLNIDAHEDVILNGDWWEACHKNGDVNKLLLKKLRWATLGYHHNWDTKVYSEDACDPFPLDLRSLCQFVSRAAGFDNFTAQAAIVNFYHMDSTLSGHTDHSEANKEAPLLSFSFGQSAIFLLGGQNLNEKPSAILIESGDIVIMSRESRLCYHGVPRILPAQRMPWLDEDAYPEPQVKRSKCGSSGDGSKIVSTDFQDLGVDTNLADKCSNEVFWNYFGDYVRTSRINLNVRQVLFPGDTCIQIPAT